MLLKKHIATLTTLGMIVGSMLTAASNQTSAPQNANSVQFGANNANTQDNQPVQIDMQKLSEAFGNFIGRNLKSPGLNFDINSIIKGIREGNEGKPSPLTDKEYEKMMAAVQEKAFKEMSAANLKKANEFMEKNKSAPGVVEIVPGKLQYLILKEGSGPVVEANSSPKINYTGKYQDGTVFGSSEETGGPITIPLAQTIPGFSKGIVGMKEGEKRRLFVHPDLGYGTTGQLPPNELLIFDIDVVKANDETKGKNNFGNSSDDEDDSNYSSEDDDFSDTSSDDNDDDDVGASKKPTATTPATKK